MGLRYRAWSRPSPELIRVPRFDVYVGSVSSTPTRLVVENDRGHSIDAGDCYVFQRGHLWLAYQQLSDRPLNIHLANPAPGLLKHALLLSPDGREIELLGIFPQSTELIIFD